LLWLGVSVLCLSLLLEFLLCGVYRICKKEGNYYEGSEKATRAGVNESQSKFLCKNWPMSQVQTPKSKPYKKVMNTPTNNIEMVSSKL
jgi:hypothetical protein